MITISLCMIVKNEEDVLARCLESVREAVDEIIIVDTGSTDRTKEIAQLFTDRVYDFEWVENFAAARNESFSKATGEYCMWLDADDVLLDADRAALLELKASLPKNVDVVMLPYNLAFDENGKPTFSNYRERLIRRGAGLLWQGEVHEVIAPAGKVIYSRAAVTHSKLRSTDPDRNLRIFEKILEDGRELEPRQQFYYARELYYHKRYDDAAHVFETFLKDGRGWVENNIEACRFLSLCLYGLGDEPGALAALLRGLAFDTPRAELNCDIARHFFDRARFREARFWYEQALACKRADQSGGFVSPDCYGYLPCIQLCVCCDRLGDEDLAIEYNERAEAFKPGSEACRHNRTYFQQKRELPVEK